MLIVCLVQVMDRAMHDKKKLEERFLAEMRMKQFEIESLQLEREETPLGKFDDIVQNLRQQLMEKEESIVMLQSRLADQISHQWISELPSAQITLQEMEQKLAVLCKQLDSERKQVLKVEQALYNLQISKQAETVRIETSPAPASMLRIAELEDLVSFN